MLITQIARLSRRLFLPYGKKKLRNYGKLVWKQQKNLCDEYLIEVQLYKIDEINLKVIYIINLRIFLKNDKLKKIITSEIIVSFELSYSS